LVEVVAATAGVEVRPEATEVEGDDDRGVETLEAAVLGGVLEAGVVSAESLTEVVCKAWEEAIEKPRCVEDNGKGEAGINRARDEAKRAC
jgi:hypothetical protein